MTSYIIQAVLGAVVGYVGNYIPMVKNNQSTITNCILGVVGSVGGNAAAGAMGVTGLGDGSNLLGTLGSGAVGSVVALLAGKLLGNKQA